ncbi:hypothetical protein [Salininema proteolyticum]|uniref:Uncharacterized protein n=1 Tax=Salininema proteolyticum TaxID=1607685 RepID=A0ABV8U4J5_9ACTN
MSEQGRFLHEAWIDGVRKHCDNKAQAEARRDWDGSEAWQRQCCDGVYRDVAEFIADAVDAAWRLTWRQCGQIVYGLWVTRQTGSDPLHRCHPPWRDLPLWQQKAYAHVFDAVEREQPPGAHAAAPPRARPAFENHGKPWKGEDDGDLMRRWEAGVSVKDLSAEFKRSLGAIKARLVKLDPALEDPPPAAARYGDFDRPDAAAPGHSATAAKGLPGASSVTARNGVGESAPETGSDSAPAEFERRRGSGPEDESPSESEPEATPEPSDRFVTVVLDDPRTPA